MHKFQIPLVFFFLTLLISVSIAVIRNKPHVKTYEVPLQEKQEPLIKILLVGDSHNSNNNLQTALNTAKENNITTAVFLGDFSNVGTQEELLNAKNVLEKSTLTYFTIPGDHEHYISEWDGREMVENYEEIFGKRYASFKLNDFNPPELSIINDPPFAKATEGGQLSRIRFILLDNGDTVNGLDDNQLYWFMDQLTQAKFKGESVYILVHIPLYHPTNPRLMGAESEIVSKQKDELLKLVRNSSAVAVIAGDQHFYSSYKDPKKNTLKHIVVGSLADERNLQKPRFGVLTIFENGDFKVEDTAL